MALVDLFYRCPGCGHDPMEGEGDEVRCGSCGVRIARRRGRLWMTAPGEGAAAAISARELCRRIDALGGPMTRATAPDGTLEYSARAMVSWRIAEDAVRHRGVLRGYSESMGPAVEGSITVDRDTVSVDGGGSDTVSVDGDRSGAGRWRHLDIGAVQAASSSLQLSLPGDRLVQFRFLGDSPRRWETLMRRLIADAWARAGRGRVVEFQPRIVARR